MNGVIDLSGWPWVDLVIQSFAVGCLVVVIGLAIFGGEDWWRRR